MGRLSAIFIAFCMALIAGSVGIVLYLSFAFTGMEAAVVTVAVLTALVMINSVSGRQRDRFDVGAQIADLSRGTADIGRQVSELDRRIVAMEGEIAAVLDHSQAATAPLATEIGELGELVKDLADAVAAHEEMLESAIRNATPTRPLPAAAPPPAPPAAARPRPRWRPSRCSPRTRPCPAPSRRPIPAPAAERPLPRRRAVRDRGAARARHRGQPDRPLSPADRHAAAAQGALLRGARAAARRRRHAADAGRLPRQRRRMAGSCRRSTI